MPEQHHTHTRHQRQRRGRQSTRCCVLRVAPPEPGAHTATVCWNSRAHWLTVVAETAMRLRPHALTNHHVSPDTFRRYLRVLAGAADHSSGRGIQLTTAQIARQVRCCEVHVRRCRRVAEDLGLYRILVPGRLMTKTERLRAHKAGSRHRGLANEAALVVPAWLLPHLVENPQVSRGAVDNVRPPSGTPVGSTQTVSSGVIADTSASKPAPPAATTNPYPPGDRPKQRWRPGYRLAVAVVDRIRWLRGTPPGHLAGMLARFERAGWNAGDVREAIELMHRRLGWASPTREQLRAPGWGLLAWYLRDLDPQADHPRADPGWDTGLIRHPPVGQLGAEKAARRDARVDPHTEQTAGATAYRVARGTHRWAHR